MATLSFHLLGPPLIRYDHQLWAISRRQVRALLYVLAADGAAYSRAQLLRLFWPDRPDREARRQLSHLLTHARRSLPTPDLLDLKANSVSLVGDIWTDTMHLVEILDGPPAHWHRGVNLYRDEFLAGVELPANAAFELWLLRERERWKRTYLTLLERLADYEVQQGATDKAIQLLSHCLELDPLSEDLQARTIRLCAQAGRRNEALRHYEDYVTLLERELGVDPSPPLRELYRSILHAAPLPEPRTSHAWTTLPTLQTPMVEREVPLEQLLGMFEEAAAGRSAACFIQGEAGIGKTRLLQEFAAAVGDRGLILYGSAAAAEHPLPYDAIIQALRTALQHREINKLSPAWLSELSRILPEIRVSHPDLPQPLTSEPSEARVRLFEALSQACLALARSRPLAICFDDLHWADATTLDWLAYFAGRMSGSGVMLLMAYRPDAESTMLALEARFRRLLGAGHIELHGLSPRALSLLLEPVGAPAQNTRLCRHLHRLSGGNPFFILEICRTLLERQETLARTYADPLPLPDSVTQLILSRLSSLTPAGKQMLEAAAVLAKDIAFSTAREMTGLDDLRATKGMDELVARQLLTQTGPTYTFIHDLTRHVVLARMSPTRRQLLHRRAALALIRQRSQAVDIIAQQFDAGGDAENALHYYEAAAERAEKLYAWQVAEAYYERMLILLDQIDPTCSRRSCQRLRCQVLSTRAEIYFLQGRLPQRDADIAALQTVAQRARDKPMLAEALVTRLRYLNLDGVYHEAVALALEGIALAEEIGEPALLSRVWAQKGFAHYFLGQPRLALAALDAAAAAAAGLSDAETHSRIAQFRGYVYYHLGDYENALAQHNRAYTLHEKTGDRNRMSWRLTDMGIMCMLLGRFQEAEGYLQRSLALAREIASQPAESYALNNLGRLRTLQGDPISALDLHRDSLKLQRKTGSKRGEAGALIFTAQAYLAMGAVDKAAKTIRQALEICRRIDYRYGLTDALLTRAEILSRNDPTAALEVAREGLKLASQIEAGRQELRALLLLAVLAKACGRAEEAERYRREARRQADALSMEEWPLRLPYVSL